MRTESEIQATLLANPQIAARLKLLDQRKEFLDSIRDYRFFDREMDGSICQQLDALNESDMVEEMTVDRIRERRIESMLCKQKMDSVESWDAGCFAEAFGFRPIREGEVATFWVGKGKEKVGWIGDLNPTNRTPVEANLEKIREFLYVGRFVRNGEGFIFDWDGHAASAQHRGWEMFQYLLLSRPNERMVLRVVRGIPPQYVDSLDIGSSRSNVQVVDRDTDFLPAEAIRDEFGVTPKAPRDERRRIVDCLNGTLRNVNLRSQGKDIHGSSGQFEQSEFTQWLHRFDEAKMQQFAVILWNNDKLVGEFKGRKKTVGELLGGLKRLGALLVLYSNRDIAPNIVGDKVKSVVIPDSLVLDVDFTRDFLQDSANSTGYLSEVFAKLATITNDDKRRIVGIACAAIRWYANKREEAVIPAPTALDPITNQMVTVGEPRIGYQCPTLPWTVADPGVPPVGRGNVWKWPNFGGLDVGYIGSK